MIVWLGMQNVQGEWGALLLGVFCGVMAFGECPCVTYVWLDPATVIHVLSSENFLAHL